MDESTEMQILQLIRKICTKQKPRDREEVKYRISKDLKVTSDQAQRFLDLLIDDELVYLEGDLVWINVLVNSTRNSIYELINNQPGIYINELERRLNINANQLLWHLNVLENMNYIRSYKFSNLRSYSLPDTPIEQVVIGYLMFQDVIRAVLEYLFGEMSSKSTTDIGQDLNISRTTLVYHLKNLASKNILVETKVRRSKHYAINPKYRNVVATCMAVF